MIHRHIHSQTYPIDYPYPDDLHSHAFTPNWPVMVIGEEMKAGDCMSYNTII
jgi:hypothetical protein